MDTPLLGPVTKRFADRTTREAFAFSFYCDQCGREWYSTPLAFAPGELSAQADARMSRLLWDGQYKAAYEQANLEAIRTFALCPVCGRRVCMSCFCRHEASGTDRCEACADKKGGDSPYVRPDL